MITADREERERELERKRDETEAFGRSAEK